jgi:hypothetical protein
MRRTVTPTSMTPNPPVLIRVSYIMSIRTTVMNITIIPTTTAEGCGRRS